MLQNVAANKKKDENTKAKLAATAASDFAAANDKLHLKSPATVTKEQATLAAFKKANDTAVEASKIRQLGLYSKTEPELDSFAAATAAAAAVAPVVEKYVLRIVMNFYCIAVLLIA